MTYQELRQSITKNGSFIYCGSILHESVARNPTNEALFTSEQTIDYKTLGAQANRISNYFVKQRFTPRSKIILLCENAPIYFSAYYGIWQTGAVIVPINTFLQEHELIHILEDSQPTAICVSRKMQDKILQHAGDAPVYIVEELLSLSNNQSSEFKPINLDPDEVSAILYTSGTTGLPKGVMLSSTNIMTNIMQEAHALQTSFNQRVLALLPLFHSYMQNTCVWSAILVGASIIIAPRLDRSSILAGLKLKPTTILGIPGLYGLFCLMKNLDFSNVHYFVSGGDALPDKIRQGFELIYRRKICNGYGLTEMSPFVSAHLEDCHTETNTVGKPMLDIQVSLRDENNKEVDKNEIGQLWLKGDNVMLGYYHAQGATNALIKDGWLNTGDLARFDTRGNLIICGREKDLIVNKGIKIYPQEV
ncbi:MAG: AMP-binding protein, partial [Rickettsia endosymbiont of Ixodes persulcatus]|nr:AMP-binding protein [Rickettsia endosymbiont of Ixodes persulcatus]